MQFDYLIIGAGASGMAFLDVILSDTDATVAVVDRRDTTGGHWNDAYPFVRLHQSSAFYGVPSRPLGNDRLIPAGLNAGLPEMADRNEILHYYTDLMERDYLPKGRVAWFPMSEHLEAGRIRHLLTGKETQLDLRGKIVNAAFLGEIATVPSTHRRSFEVAERVTCIPPNDLPRHAAAHNRFTVLGAGKTAMDTVLWLLSNSVPPEAITWVRPRDYWLYVRENVVPDAAFFGPTMKNAQAELRSLATSRDIHEHCTNLEACGRWHRIDPDIWPTGFHAAVCSRPEVAALRTVTEVVRKGHVSRIEPERMILAQGDVTVTGAPLYIDCTASGGAILGDTDSRVFERDRINLLMIRPFQPLFSSALIARIEATIPDNDTKQTLTRVTDFHDTPTAFLAAQMMGMVNQYNWGKHPDLRDWIDRCRLNAAHHLMQGISADTPEKLAVLGEMGLLTRAAMENLPNLLTDP